MTQRNTQLASNYLQGDPERNITTYGLKAFIVKTSFMDCFNGR